MNNTNAKHHPVILENSKADCADLLSDEMPPHWNDLSFPAMCFSIDVHH